MGIVYVTAVTAAYSMRKLTRTCCSESQILKREPLEWYVNTFLWKLKDFLIHENLMIDLDGYTKTKYSC